MLMPKPAMWFAAVDYIRGTIRGKTDEATHNAIICAVERAASETLAHSYRPEAFSFMGFRGERFGSSGWGWRDDFGYLVQASGLSASRLFDARLPYTNLARIDVQVTFWFENYEPEIAKRAFLWSKAARIGRGGRPWTIRYIDGAGDGDTTYLGRRGKRSKFARVYDKYKESKENEAYINAWRFEFEFSDDFARDVYGTLLDVGASPEVCAALVARYFDDWGVRLYDIKDVALFDVKRLPVDKGSTERRLMWLENQVAPAIDKLLLEGVSLSQVGQSLGLLVTGTD